jgi:glycosyltransferase involved in cell wall biosynthesis
MPRVALLINFVAPYQLPLFEALQARCSPLRIFVSTPMESNRNWRVEWGTLDVAVQRNVTFRKRWRHLAGFTDAGFVHVPYDTFAQLARFKPDAIISSELGARTVLAAAYKLRHPQVRFAVWATLSEHTESNRGRLRGLLRPSLLRRADTVFVNGRSGARYVQKLGVPKQRVVLAPYTPDLSAFRNTVQLPGSRGTVRFLYAGLLVERKGLLPFLTVLRRWAEANPALRIDFAIVGDGPLRPALEHFVCTRNLTIRVLKAVPYDRLPALYATADIFVLPTLADEWGVVVNEAMAAGLPVLGSLNSQAVEELVIDGETGWSFTPEDAETVYAAIERACHATADEWRRMGAVAAHRVLQSTPDLVADRIAETLCPSPQSS